MVLQHLFAAQAWDRLAGLRHAPRAQVHMTVAKAAKLLGFDNQEETLTTAS